jgi:2-oxoglutarate ferredoxin oxidoreductase subunit beta
MPTATAHAPTPDEPKLTKKALTADHPTWCPGCGDFAVLASFYRALEQLNYPHEKIVTMAGIGCSSRFPYFVNTHGGHFIHGRSVPFSAGISLSRPDLKVFVFGGDGDGFSIGGNHLDHVARKNVDLTYVIMDNQVYGLTKKQTSPTSPEGFKSKTDPWGAIDQPINPMRKLVNSGATFVARSHATQVKHMVEMMKRAAEHPGFAVVEIISECIEFFPGAFDSSVPRKGGEFVTIDEEEHDTTDLTAAMTLASEPWPGRFGVYLEINRPTKNAMEEALNEKAKTKAGNASDADLLKSTFAKMR